MAAKRRPVFDAAARGDLGELTKLLDAGADPNQAGSHKRLALQAASRGDAEDCALLLLARGANANGKEKGQITPLIVAAGKGQCALVEALIAAGAKLDAKAHMTAGGDSPLGAAAQFGHIDIVRTLIAAGAQCDNLSNGNGMAPLALAARAGHGEVVDVLLDAGAQVDACAPHTVSPLSWAAGAGHRAIAMRLLDAGATLACPPSAPGVRRPLIAACDAGDEPLAREMLDRGAEVDAFAGNATALGFVLMQRAGWQKPIDRKPLVELLLERGADPNASSNPRERRPLHHAAFDGAVSPSDDAPFRAWAVGRLIAAGADVDAQDPSGNTPLIYAARAAHLPMVEQLLQAKPNLALTDLRQATALHAATRGSNYIEQRHHPQQRTRIAQLLLDQGAPHDVADADGVTPLMSAAFYGLTDVVKLLLDRNASIAARHKTTQGTALHYAIAGYANNGFGVDPALRASCLKMLRDAGADLAAQDKDGLTPVALAERLNNHVLKKVVA